MSRLLSSSSVPKTLMPEHERVLDERLDSLRAATESLGAPVHLEATLMSAFKVHHAKSHAAKRRSEFITQWFAPGFALAASVGMSAWMVLAPLAQPVLDKSQFASIGVDAGISTDAPFIALQSLEQIAMEPQPRLIEAHVPRMWLAAYGVSVNPESAGDAVRAEMLVSASGQPLAMRFLP